MTGFGKLIFFTNTCLVEFEVIYLALFLLFLVIDSFEWFWMASLHKNIQLMLEFLKAKFLVLQFFYYTLMTFVIMLYAILLSMLMILLSILSVIRHLICATTRIVFWTWIWSMRHCTGARSGFLSSILGKLNWFCLTGVITLVVLIWKWMGLSLRKNNLFRCWDWPSLLNWIGALTLSLLIKLEP